MLYTQPGNMFVDTEVPQPWKLDHASARVCSKSNASPTGSSTVKLERLVKYCCTAVVCGRVKSVSEFFSSRTTATELYTHTKVKNTSSPSTRRNNNSLFFSPRQRGRRWRTYGLLTTTPKTVAKYLQRAETDHNVCRATQCVP